MIFLNNNNKYKIKYSLVLLSLLFFASRPVLSIELSLGDALKIALGSSSRGNIIEGNFEVAEQQYFAKKINFLLPRISLNSSVPSYRVNESYRFFGGSTEKSLYKNRDFDFSTNIKFEQSLITGGDLTVRANLLRSDARYPNTVQQGIDINELTRTGNFDFDFVQPLLKPSTAKFDLNNKKDDMEIARLNRQEEIAGLKNEVTEAYIGLMELRLEKEIASDRLKSAIIVAGIDSIKISDGIIAEEDYLESLSKKLDAELEEFDVSIQYSSKLRVLKSLLDIDNREEISLAIPKILSNISEADKQRAVSNWENAVPLKRSEYRYKKDKRASNFASSSNGLTGNFQASYSLGRGNVENDFRLTNEDIETNSWGISLNLTFPIWDGGASGATVKASQLSAEKTRLEYDNKLRSMESELETLVNQIDIGFQKMQILSKKIELAKSKLEIAKFRVEDGQISEVEYLNSHIFYLNAKVSHIKELKKYLIDIHNLESKYIS